MVRGGDVFQERGEDGAAIVLAHHDKVKKLSHKSNIRDVTEKHCQVASGKYHSIF